MTPVRTPWLFLKRAKTWSPLGDTRRLMESPSPESDKASEAEPRRPGPARWV